MCSQCLSHTGPAPAHGTCALPAHTAQVLGCSAGNCPRPALGSMYLAGPSCSGSGTWVVLRGADSVGPAFCALPSSDDEVFGECGRCDLSPSPSLPLSFLGVQPVQLLRRMLTIQNPSKSQLTKKPACSLVDNVFLGLQFPPSGSGCLSLEGDGLQPPSSVQSFAL